MVTFYRCLSLELNDWHAMSVGGVNLILKPKVLTIALGAKIAASVSAFAAAGRSATFSPAQAGKTSQSRQN
jgi:hypothetical protein